jgi:hypothetical protein
MGAGNHGTHRQAAARPNIRQGWHLPINHARPAKDQEDCRGEVLTGLDADVGGLLQLVDAPRPLEPGAVFDTILRFPIQPGSRFMANGPDRGDAIEHHAFVASGGTEALVGPGLLERQCRVSQQQRRPSPPRRRWSCKDDRDGEQLESTAGERSPRQGGPPAHRFATRGQAASRSLSFAAVNGNSHRLAVCSGWAGASAAAPCLRARTRPRSHRRAGHAPARRLSDPPSRHHHQQERAAPGDQQHARDAAKPVTGRDASPGARMPRGRPSNTGS